MFKSNKHSTQDRSYFNKAKALLRKDVLIGGLAGASIGVVIGRSKGLKDLKVAEANLKRIEMASTGWQKVISGTKDLMYEKLGNADLCKLFFEKPELQVECKRLQNERMNDLFFGRQLAQDQHALALARNGVKNKMFYGGMIGLPIGIVAALVCTFAWKQQRVSLSYQAPIVKNGKISGKDAAQAEKQKKNESTNPGFDPLISQSGSWKTGEIELDPETKKARREAKEKEVELAIRGICGSKYSRAVAFSLVAGLSHRQTQLLLEEPANLGNIMAAHSELISPELRKYGLTIDQVLAEIRKRMESRVSSN